MLPGKIWHMFVKWSYFVLLYKLDTVKVKETPQTKPTLKNWSKQQEKKKKKGNN